MKRFSDSELNELEYPDVTFGSILAREIREKCNKLTRQEREELFRAGMASIYGASEATEVKSSVDSDIMITYTVRLGKYIIPKFSYLSFF